jgi:glutathione S-transferase
VVPVLWHLKVSHYSEKARWALDFKGVEHRRRAALPGRHARIARRLWGGTTFPVLVADGEAIGDSTRIIAALERRHPERPLYPEDLAAREHALALEDLFDEQLGPHARLLVVHHELPDAGLFLGTFVGDLRGPRRLAARAAMPAMRPRLRARFDIDDSSVALAFDRLRAAGARFAAAVGPTGYLVGDAFTVADLTLAALLAPVVAPAEFPYPQPQRDHPRLAPVREALAGSGLLDWTREMYARHRLTRSRPASGRSGAGQWRVGAGDARRPPPPPRQPALRG